MGLERIVLFDGVCNFCNGTVNFIMDKDKKRVFKFAALQSEAGQRLLGRFGLKQSDFDTIILIEGERCYERSAAVLRIAKGLGGIWKIFYVLIVIPSFVRDFFYDIIARNRYRWFGRNDECRVPTAEERERFLGN